MKTYILGDEKHYFSPLEPPNSVISPSSQNQTYNVGDDAEIECGSVTGVKNRYQWQLDGANITGATSPVLSLPDVQASQGGTYTCIVTNIAGTTSANTLLFIAPNLLNQPASVMVNSGSSATLFCEAEAFPTPTYQWRRVNGLPFRNGIVTDTVMLTINPVLFGDEGSYYCEVTSGDRTLRSQGAAITGKLTLLALLA